VIRQLLACAPTRRPARSTVRRRTLPRTPHSARWLSCSATTGPTTAGRHLRSSHMTGCTPRWHGRRWWLRRPFARAGPAGSSLHPSSRRRWRSVPPGRSATFMSPRRTAAAPFPRTRRQLVPAVPHPGW